MISVPIASYIIMFCIAIYIELTIFHNIRRWWWKAIWIIFAYVPSLFEPIFLLIIKKKNRKITLDLFKLIEKEELPLFINFNTFLKLYHKMPLEEYVVELGIKKDNLSLSIMKRITLLEIKLKSSYSFNGEITQYKFIWKNMSILVYVVDSNEKFMSYSLNPDKVFIFKKFNWNIVQYDLHGIKIFGPEHPEKFINHFYNKYWKKLPNKYVYSYGPNKEKSIKGFNTKLIEKKSYL